MITRNASFGHLLKKRCLLIIILLLFPCQLIQAAFQDDFEAGVFKSDWIAKNIATIVHNPGQGANGSDYYVHITGAEANEETLGGYFVNSSPGNTPNFILSFSFRFTDTNQRQFNVTIGPPNLATNNNTGSDIFINLAYDGSDNRFEAYAGSWKPLTGLPNNLTSNDWHSVAITGRNFGTAGAQYDVAVDGITQTGITYFHGAAAATSLPVGGFNFNDRFGDNPGFDIDNVRVEVPGTILITETNDNTKVKEAGTTSDTFTIAPGSQPEAPVTVDLNVLENPAQINVTPHQLVFTPSDFTAKTITVTAVDDNNTEDYFHNSTLTFTVSSADPDYQNLSIPDLTMIVVDDESTYRYPCFSGIYPHTAVTNTSNECGIGAVVNWANNLWYVTYAPHEPRGSTDKFYQLDDDLMVTIRPESIGGTPANRMIHSESNQLFIGSYIIDEAGNTRTIPLTQMPGRMSANARHLFDPANKIYYYTMEEGLYEVDVHTLEVTTLHPDRNTPGVTDLIPGNHGKGAYSGQGRLVISNNGTGGALAEWDGSGDPGLASSWVIIDQNKYTDITGPGGIYGNTSRDDPLWAIGWDNKSVLLNVCDHNGHWKRFRLPKASYTHDADHGWFTEWPRIRPADPQTRMMDMHGMFYRFPDSFSHDNTAGIQPLSTHLKMVVDWEYRNGRLIWGCNDASQFSNPTVDKALSNLRFTTLAEIADLGRPMGFGGPWIQDSIEANVPSEPIFINGFDHRVIHFTHDKGQPVHFMIEVDKSGTDSWSPLTTVTVEADGYGYYILPTDLSAEWLRLKTDTPIHSATAYLHYSSDQQTIQPKLLASLPQANEKACYSTGLIRGRNVSELTLQFAADMIDADGTIAKTGYYEIGEDMRLIAIDAPDRETWLRNTHPTTQDFTVDDASVIVTYHGEKFRLPKNDPAYDSPGPSGWPRGIRELVTERQMMNIHGTFYELPYSASGGMWKIRPITTHNRKIFDFCSWRGMLVMSGNFTDAPDDDHYVRSTDDKTGLWFGNVDDLYNMGIPRGVGGPWKNTPVKANTPSLPYLMTGYDNKTVELSHNLSEAVTFTLEVDFLGANTWSSYKSISVPAGKIVRHEFPVGYNAHWIRIKTDKECTATAWLIYNPLYTGQDGLKDFIHLARNWRCNFCSPFNGADLNFDGQVNMSDFVRLLNFWLT